MELEALLTPIEDGIAKNIGRQKVTGKLDTLKGESERPGQCLRERCLANTRNILDQKMTTREQTGDRKFNRLILAYDNFTNLLRERVNVVGHSEIICGNAAIRK
jgi:hypothetical protein